MWLLGIAIAIFIVIIIVRKAKSTPNAKGEVGEMRVSKVLGENIEGMRYLINNYTISHNGTTSQIDHIFINSRGVFVIETKNYSGQIYGDDNRHEWTQVLQYGKVKNKFYNPVKQNATHTYWVRSILKNVPVHSLVVFVQNNTANINSNVVIPICNLSVAVNQGPVVLNSEQIKQVYYTLNQHREYVNREEHVANINRMRTNINNNICPRCSGKLVLKNGKYGEFWGCSNYPKCKFIKGKKG